MLTCDAKIEVKKKEETPLKEMITYFRSATQSSLVPILPRRFILILSKVCQLAFVQLSCER